MQRCVGMRRVAALLLTLRVLLPPAACEPAELRLLVLSPYPSKQFPPSVVGWTGGPALFPAAQFAADAINNRTDILPRHTIKLINRDSGCALPYRATVTIAREKEDAKRNLKPYIGIIGPACSSAAMEIGGLTIAKYADVASITIATGPLLSTANLTNTFRLYSSAKLSAKALLQLMVYAGWTYAAAIVDFSHWYYPQIYSSFRELVATTSPDISVEMLNFHNPFPFIRNRYNVIVVFGGTQRSAESLCTARNLGLIFPHYQWIFLDVELDGLIDTTTVKHSRGEYKCTVTDMREAAHEVIAIRSRLARENKDSNQTHCGLSYNEFFSTYHEYYRRHLIEEGITLDEVDNGSEEWAASYFDAVWAFALAIDQSLQESEEVIPPTATIRSHLLALNFSGLTGEIRFHKDTLEVSSVIELYQLDKDLAPRRIATFYEGSLNVSESAIFVQPIKKEMIVVSNVALGIFFLTGVIIFATIGVVHVIYVVFRDCQSIRAQSPHFVHIIFSGCYLFLLAALLETFRAANWTGYSEVDSTKFRIALGTLCNAIYWCLALSSALIFGTMCVLSWRIYRIFTHFLNPGKIISDPILAGTVGAIVTVHVAILVAWSTFDPLLARFVLSDEGLTAGVLPYYQYCDCDYFNIWLLEWVLHEAVIFLVVMLSISNRHVPKKDYVNNTRSYNATVYIISFLNGLCIPVYFAYTKKKNIDMPYVIFQTFTLGSPLTALVLLFLPPLVPLFRDAKSNIKYECL